MKMKNMMVSLAILSFLVLERVYKVSNRLKIN
jgi:hypothetical protein